MKKLFLIFLPIILFSSCSVDWHDEKDAKIAELQKIIEEQKIENQKLKDEINTLGSSVGWDKFSQATLWDGVSAPEDMTFSETSSKDCIEKAQAEFMEAGNKQCEQMGFTKEDMLARKCKLPKTFIDVIQKKLQDAELSCGPGQ